MNTDTHNMMALDMSGSDATMDSVMKNIYTSCDPNNLNLVPTAELIEFIRPYLLEDLSALETLRNMLDPENKNITVAGEQFYNVMNEWTQKIASHSEEESNIDFNQTPSQLNVPDEKALPYRQSTPRASFGQKLLSCEGLLNLSNVSSYNISPTKQTKDISTSGPEKTILEEEVKQLQYQLSKVMGEMDMLKVQLAFSEEQNEMLQDDLKVCRTRLQSEQHVNGNIEENKNCVEDLREEINYRNRRIEELNKKLNFCEKDNAQLNTYVHKLETKNSELEERCEHFAKTEQNLKNEIIYLKTELEMKEHEITSISRTNDELKLNLCQKMTELEQLLSENEILDYKQQDLEKMLSSKRYSLSSHYNTCLDEMSFLTRDQGGDGEREESPRAAPGAGPYESLQTELFQVDPQFDHKEKNGSDFEYEDQIIFFKTENESLQNKLDKAENENKILSVERNTMQDKAQELEKKLNNLMLEKQRVKEAKTDKNKAVDSLKQDLRHLKDDFTRLQLELDAKEQENPELKNSFNFEAAYKKLETNYSGKIAEIEQLQKSLRESQYTIRNLANSKNDLEKSLEAHKKQLHETKEKVEHRELINSTIQQTANKVQAHVDDKSTVLSGVQSLNTELKSKVENLEKELKDKIKQLGLLKDVLKHDLDIKNNMWRDIEELRENLQGVTKDYSNTLKTVADNENIQKEMQADYNKLLDKFNEEVFKNAELSDQILKQSKDLSAVKLKYDKLDCKYNEELSKKLRLAEEVSILKNQLENIKENQRSSKEDLLRKLTECENSMQSLYSKIKDLECENNILKTDLTIEKQKSSTKLSEDRSDTESKDFECEDNGVKSELELDEEHKRYTDGDASSESSTSFDREKTLLAPKNRSFAKQKLTADRLKEELRHERSKYELLKDRLSCKVEELEKMQQVASSEKQNLKTVINHLRTKLQEQEEFYKQLGVSSSEKIKELSMELSRLSEKHSDTLSNSTEKESLLKRHFEANEYNKNVIVKLDKDFRECKRIQSNLSADLAAKEITLKTVCVENQNLKQFVKCSDNKIRELSAKLAYQEAALKKFHFDLAGKHQEIARLSSILSDRDGKIQTLTSAAAAYEIRLSNVSLEMSEKDEAYSKLENELKTVTLDAASKNEEIASLSSILLDRDSKIETLTSAAAAFEIRLSNILLELSEKEEAYSKLELELKTVTENLLRTADVNDKLRDSEEKLRNNTCDFESKSVNGHVKSETTFDRISRFTDTISECCHELNGVFTRFTEQWKNKIESHPDFKNLPFIKLCRSLNVEDVLSVIVDNIRAVISLLNIMSTTTAPDSMDDDAESHLKFLTNRQSAAKPIDPKTVKKFTLRPSKLHSIRPVSPDSPESDPRDKKLDCEEEDASADSQSFKAAYERVGQGENVRCYNAAAYLPLISFDLPMQDAFPHVSDAILVKLGLHETSPKVKLTKEETEEIFTAFAIQVGLDSKDIKNRLQKQQEICTQKYRNYQSLLKNISVRLREHNCIGAMDPINPVFVMLEDVRFMMQELMQSAGKLGVLTCEHRMTKCWNLVTNYMAIIKQDLENHKEHPSPIRCLRLHADSSPGKEKVRLKSSRINTREKKETQKDTKEQNKGSRSCLSTFAHCVMWVSLVILLFVVGAICVHWQCKMTTQYKICPLDDIIRIISQRVGNPPY